jgi:hypothetical protein
MRKAWLAVPIFLLAAAGWFQSANREIAVSIPQSTIQHSLDARLPMRGHAQALTWTVEKAVVTLPGGGDVAVDATVHGAMMRWSATAHVTGRAKLAYRDGAFWLSDVRVDGLSVDSADAAASANGELEVSVARLLAGRLARHPDGALDLLMSHVPVYRIADDTPRGVIARAVLSSVQASNGELDVWLDPAGALVRLLGWCVVVASAALAAMLLVAFAAGGGEVSLVTAVGSIF